MATLQTEDTQASDSLDPTSEGASASLVGWYGFENAGDDAFFAVLCKWLIEEFGVGSISVSGCHTRLPKTPEQLPATIQGNESERVLGRIERFLHEPKNLFGHDIVVFGGGSIFSSRRFWWLAVQMWTINALRKLGFNRTVVAGIGISIGPFRKLSDSFWCKQALRSFDAVVVRDAKSAEIGEQYSLSPLISSMDLALVLPSFYEVAERATKSGQTDSPIIGFSIVDRDTENGLPQIDEVKRAAIIKSLLGVTKRYPRSQFKGFVFCKHTRAGDYAATEKVLAPLREAGCQVEQVEYANDPVSLCQQIADLDAMVCNRMHSFVFACITRTPAVMISYAPKMEEFAKTVELPDELLFRHDQLDDETLRKRLLQIIEDQRLPCDEKVLAGCCEKVMADLGKSAEILRERLRG